MTSSPPVSFSIHLRAALAAVAMAACGLAAVVGYAAHLGGAAFGFLYYMLRLRYKFAGALPPRL